MNGLLVRFGTPGGPHWFLSFPHDINHVLVGDEYSVKRCAELICKVEGCCLDDFADLNLFTSELVLIDEAQEMEVRNDDGTTATLWECFQEELKRGEPAIVSGSEY